MGILHRDAGKNEASLHRFGFLTDTDPAATHGTGEDGVEAGQAWIQHASGAPDSLLALKLRNNANDGWVTLLGAPIPWTTVPSVSSGDLLYGNGANSLATLGIGTARQILQTNAGATAPEWTSNIDVPGTLDVTGAGTFDSTLTSVGAATLDTGANGSSFGGDLTVTGDLTVSGAGPHSFGAGLVGINETANANQTVGLTINQGANDDEILALKSSDVSHKLTAETEADSYGVIGKVNSTSGGLYIQGFSEGSNGPAAVRIEGLGDAANTAKTTGAVGLVSIGGSVDDGSNNATGLGADGNIVTIRDNMATTRFIFDVEGSAHADVEWTTFDRMDDLRILEDMEALLAPGFVKRRFGEVVRHDREFFERHGLFHDIRSVGEGRMRGMMNQTKMLMLHSGAIRQVGGMAADLRSRTDRLEDALRETYEANPGLEKPESVRALLN